MTIILTLLRLSLHLHDVIVLILTLELGESSKVWDAEKGVYAREQGEAHTEACSRT